VRFGRVRERLAGAGPSEASLAMVAAECGDADQAHLTREFGGFAGCTPTDYVGEVRGERAVLAVWDHRR
jgi:transcriptional regulator GlxA family with amidase domain